MTVNVPSGLEEQQKALIRKLALEGADWKKAHAMVCGIKPVTQTLVKQMMEKYTAGLSAKADAKKEGARLIEKFLNGAKEGADVDDLAALLEQAVYRDILRRYSDSGEPLVSMTMEQLLKLDLAYRGARLAKAKHEKEKSKNDNGKEGNELDRLRTLFDEKSAGSSGKEKTGPTASAGVAR